MQPIFIVTGPPAAGKTAFCCALLQHYDRGLHIPVDDLREWVVAGIAHPIGWTDETTRQFALAEHAAADLALRYNDAGFAVALDHCAGPPSLNELVQSRLQGRLVHCVILLPTLETNLGRNSSRAGKNFELSILEPTIRRLNPMFRQQELRDQGWLLVENEQDGIENAVASLISMI